MKRIRPIVLGLSLLGFLTAATSSLNGGERCIYNAYFCPNCDSTQGEYICLDFVLPGTGGYCTYTIDNTSCTSGYHQCGSKVECMDDIPMGLCGSTAYCNTIP